MFVRRMSLAEQVISIQTDLSDLINSQVTRLKLSSIMSKITLTTSNEIDSHE